MSLTKTRNIELMVTVVEDTLQRYEGFKSTLND